MENASNFKGYDSVFAIRLRELMEHGINGKKTTQQDLAGITGYTRQAISQYMDGSVMPNIEKLSVVAKAFNVSADYLLGLSETKTLDTSIRAICEYTGLSEEAVENLHRHITFRRENGDDKRSRCVLEAQNLFFSIPWVFTPVIKYAAEYKQNMKILVANEKAQLETMNKLFQLESVKKTDIDKLGSLIIKGTKVKKEARVSLFEAAESARDFSELFAEEENIQHEQLEEEIIQNEQQVRAAFNRCDE